MELSFQTELCGRLLHNLGTTKKVKSQTKNRDLELSLNFQELGYIQTRNKSALSGQFLCYNFIL